MPGSVRKQRAHPQPRSSGKSALPAEARVPVQPGTGLLDSRVLALAIVVTLSATFGVHRLIDPDFFQQIAVGRQIISEPASFGISTFVDDYPSYHYVEDKWLPSVVVAAIDMVAAEHGLMLYQIALCIGVGLAWYGMQRRWGGSRYAAVLGTALALLACAFRLEPRPDTISHALLALVVLSVATPASRAVTGYTLLLFALWINVHGYFVNGMLVMVAAAAATFVGDDVLNRSGMPAWRDRVMLIIAALGACLLHPQGWLALLSPVEQLAMLRSEAFHVGIQELQPVRELLAGTSRAHSIALLLSVLGPLVAGSSIASPFPRQAIAAGAGLLWFAWPPPAMADAIPYQTSAALWILALTEVPSALKTRRYFPVFLFAGFSLLAIPAVRNLPLLVPPCLLLLVPSWAHIGESSSRAQPARRAFAVGLLILLATTIAWGRLSDRLNGYVRGPTRTGWGIDSVRFPVGAANYLAAANLPGRLLNNFDVGGYLLYRLHPGRRVFIAGNTAMFPVSFFEYYDSQVVGSQFDLERLARERQITTVVWDLVSTQAQRIFPALVQHPQWKLVYLDHAAAVFTTAQSERPLDLDHRITELATQDVWHPALPVELGGKALLFPALNLPAFLQTIGRPDLALRAAEPLWSIFQAEPLAALIGTAATQTNSIGPRLPLLEEALQRFPSSQDLQTLLFTGYATQANELLLRGDLETADRHLRRMTELQPNACGPYLGLAKTAVTRGDVARGKSMAGAALARDADGSCRRGLLSDPSLTSLVGS